VIDALTLKIWRLPFESAMTRLVALAIARRCGDEHGVCFAKHTTIAADCPVHPKTVQRSIAELEALGWITKVKRPPRADGSKQTDLIYLSLPAVTLPANGPNEEGFKPSREIEELDGLSTPGSPESVSRGVVSPEPGSPGLPKKESLVEDNQSEDVRASEPTPFKAEEPDLDEVTGMIWTRVGAKGRQRSSKAKVKKALGAALDRRPRGQDVWIRLEQILRGIHAYLQSSDATKDDGAFEHGAHRTLEGDVWESYLQDAPGTQSWHAGGAMPNRSASGVAGEHGPEEVVSEAQLHRLWMRLHQEGRTWPPERGPQPGRVGCVVSPEIQREFGVEPFGVILKTGTLPGPGDIVTVDPAALADDAAFD
jgi:hypothetical protein